MLYPPRVHCSSFHARNSVACILVSPMRVNLSMCSVTAPRLGESCDMWCAHASVWRKLAGGSGLLEEVEDCRQDERPTQPLQVDGGRASV